MNLRRLSLFILLLVAGSACAQATLSVNGREVEGLTLSLVPGVSYAPANQFAAAMGARLYVDYGSGLVSLEVGGRLAVLPTVDDPALAASMTVTVNGAARSGLPAVFSDGVLHVPVGLLADAFGGYTSYVPDGERVLVVLPRGRLTGMETSDRGSSERIVLTLSANVPYSVSYNEGRGALELRFDRTEVAGAEPVTGRSYFSRAGIVEGTGTVTISISLDEGSDFQVYPVPMARGYQLVIDLFEAADDSEEVVEAPLVVLDAAHGGEDGGEELAAAQESDLTLDLALALASRMEDRGYRVSLSRSGDHDVPLSTRAGLGVGADLFLSLHVHGAPAGEVAVYYLSEADGAASLDMAIRQNAASELTGTTDALRRRLLLNLVPDLDVGRRYALGLQAELFAATGLRVADPRGAPLAVLAGAAGRGLLVEFPADDYRQEAAVEALAAAIEALLDGAR